MSTLAEMEPTTHAQASGLSMLFPPPIYVSRPGGTKHMIRNLIAVTALAAATLLMPSTAGLPTSAAAEAVGTEVFGVISTNTTWSAAGSPYRVVGPIDVPYGVTLTIEPGVTVVADGASVLFRIAGKVSVAAGEQPAVLDGNGTAAIAMPHPSFTGAQHAQFEVLGAVVRDATTLWSATAPVAGGHLTLADSTIINVPGESYIAPLFGPVTISNNLFVNSGGLNIGYPTSYGYDVQVKYNRFRGPSPSGYYVYGRSTPGGHPIEVHYNTFEPATQQFAVGAGLADVDAINNYWGTSDRLVVAGRILDGYDEPGSRRYVSFEPFYTYEPMATRKAVPTAPQNVDAVAGDGEITLRWQPPLGNGGSPITAYTATASPGGLQETVTGDATEATITGLTNGVAYTVAVSAVNGLGVSDPAPSGDARIPSGRPFPPTDVTAEAGDGTATVYWSEADPNGQWDITSYTVTASPGGATTTVDGNARQATLSLSNGTAYTFTVTATNALGSSDPSSSAGPVTPADIPPTSPVFAGALTLAGTSITLRWTNPADVDWSRTMLTRQEGIGVPVTIYSGRATTVTDTSAAVGHTYTYSLVAVDGAGNRSGTVTRQATALARPVMKVATPTSSASTTARFPVSWSAGNPAGTRYNVRYTYRDGSSWALRPTATWLSNTTAAAATFGATATSPLTPKLGYTYYLQAEARDAYGNTTGYTQLAKASVPLDQNSASYASGWTSASAPGRWLGTLRITKTHGAKSILDAYGRAFQIVGDRCTSCGSFKVYLDGIYTATVNTYATRTRARQVLWAASPLGGIAKHRIAVVPVLSGGKQIRLDAFTTIR